MIFSSITFLYFFFPVVILIYTVSPQRLKNVEIFISSVFFYAWGEKLLALLFVCSIFIGWVAGLLIEKNRGKKLSKIYLILIICIDLGILFYFKYTNFFIQTINIFLRHNIPLLKIVLPIGISFYTFQLISYEIDVYRGTVFAQKNFIDFAAYVAMFPQLIAGPIVRYSDIEQQLKNRTHSFEKNYEGIKRFIIGFSKKIIIANSLGEITVIFRNSNDLSVLFYWLYAVSFMLQIYYDFSGYSDMAIGLGKILGFDFMENFNYPYISKSITEFWRRWHISLGSWFRDYVYIPLGGNKKGLGKQIINIFIVWMLTGLWHGAAFNFVLWGILYGVLLMLEKLFLKKLLDKHTIIGHIYMIVFVMFGFVLFNAESLQQCISDISGMFAFSKLPLISKTSLYYLTSYLITIFIAIIGSTPVIKIIYNKLKSGKLNKIICGVEPVILICLLLLGTAFLVDGSFNPFLYFRF